MRKTILLFSIFIMLMTISGCSGVCMSCGDDISGNGTFCRSCAGKMYGKDTCSSCGSKDNLVIKDINSSLCSTCYRKFTQSVAEQVADQMW